MDRVYEARDKAVRNLKIADHMLTQTYPSVKDPKILLSVLENVFLALTNSMAAILYYEYHNKRIPGFDENFNSKFDLFKLNVAGRYRINKEYITLISTIKSILVNHKKSPVEFSRKDAFVICSDGYDMKTLTEKEMKAYIEKTKGFLQDMQNITSQNERIS
ncbi:hypothetical protein COV19_04760 [Candidatus Woesearchaeota archaeon CG10_big_fil_rev_8_21_14_0_10_44_13]|nr:MAG: hypothetical protein COV19_04760 [Candidatus Woesearchaeota archaeon CG10_big_fil_rev_8_21_14_0_10_44_13]